MLGIEVPKETIAQQAKEMLDIIDVDGDGEISKEEFIKKAETCDFICNALQVINGQSNMKYELSNYGQDDYMCA